MATRIAPGLFPYLPKNDTVKDFDAVASIVKSRYMLVLNPPLPANTLQELIALAKSRPGQLNYMRRTITVSEGPTAPRAV